MIAEAVVVSAGFLNLGASVGVAWLCAKWSLELSTTEVAAA